MKELGLLELLRYALSGGIGMAVLLLTYPAAACSIRGMDATKETTLILGSILLIGTLIYNLHRALLFPFFFRIVGLLVPWKFSWKQLLMFWRWSWKQLLLSWQPSEYELKVDRWRWEHPEKKRKRWDEWGAQTHSLYCAAWAISATLLVGWYTWGRPHRCALLFFGILAVVTLAGGVVNNYRLLYSIDAEMKRPSAEASGDI
jgi:hypothetical protein